VLMRDFGTDVAGHDDDSSGDGHQLFAAAVTH